MVLSIASRPSGDDVSSAVRAAVQAIQARLPATLPAPRVALILGSGLGQLADRVSVATEVPYADIPGFPRSTVPGHAGVLVLGTLAGMPVVAMRGRVHFYEGYSLRQVTLPVRVMRRLGADTLIVTNAAGGLNPAFRAGDLMLLADHLNLMGLAGHNPLLGPPEPELGARFLDMLAAYEPELRAIAHRVARDAGFPLREGVYVMVGGPSYETAAEVRFLQRAGADAVGMSTIPEVIVARQEQMRVLGISVITNQTVGAVEVSHQEVLAAADAAKPRLEALVQGVLGHLAAQA